MHWYVKCIKSYINFKGRAGWKEFWGFFLFNLIFTIAATTLDNIFKTTTNLSTGFGNSSYGYIAIIYSLVTLLPLIAVGVRRLHDTGKSAFWYLVLLIPIFGELTFLLLMTGKSQSESNKYGQ